jgi:hypothetical protein
LLWGFDRDDEVGVTNARGVEVHPWVRRGEFVEPADVGGGRGVRVERFGSGRVFDNQNPLPVRTAWQSLEKALQPAEMAMKQPGC